MSASSWSVSSARSTCYHNCSRDSRPDGGASNSKESDPFVFLGARCLGHFCFPFSRQFEKHAQSVIETFLVVTLFPFFESALPRFTLSAKRLCNILVKSASRLGGPPNPHRRNIRSASLKKPIAFQHAPISTVKQCCLPWHGITSVSGSLQISIQVNRGPLLRRKCFPAPLTP